MAFHIVSETRSLPTWTFVHLYFAVRYHSAIRVTTSLAWRLPRNHARWQLQTELSALVIEHFLCTCGQVDPGFRRGIHDQIRGYSLYCTSIAYATIGMPRAIASKRPPKPLIEGLECEHPRPKANPVSAACLRRRFGALTIWRAAELWRDMAFTTRHDEVEIRSDSARPEYASIEGALPLQILLTTPSMITWAWPAS